MASFVDRLREAERHLRDADPVLDALIMRIGPCRLRPQRHRFDLLARIVISQQLATAVADRMHQRLRELVGRPVRADELLAQPTPALRGIGLSQAKAETLQRLARAVAEGELRLERLSRLPDDKITAALTAYKGLGPWSAQMYLMFGLVRFDVLPVGDLGLRTALKRSYELPALPDPDACLRLALPWRPYATIASWYLWRSLELDTGAAG